MMRIVAFAWLVFLYLVSMAPFHVKLHLRTMGRMHNLGHGLAFFITTLLFAWNAKTLPSILLRSFVVLGIALTLEWLEYFEYHNAYEWSDVCIDAIGIMIGFVVLTMVLFQRESGTKRTA